MDKQTCVSLMGSVILSSMLGKIDPDTHPGLMEPSTAAKAALEIWDAVEKELAPARTSAGAHIAGPMVPLAERPPHVPGPSGPATEALADHLTVLRTRGCL